MTMSCRAVCLASKAPVAGADEPPTISIFELLDYIVNQVRRRFLIQQMTFLSVSLVCMTPYIWNTHHSWNSTALLYVHVYMVYAPCCKIYPSV